MARSTCVHPDWKSEISPALERNGFLTQGALAANLLMALSTVNNFCRGIKVSVSKFEEICDALDLEPSQISRPLNAKTVSLEEKSAHPLENDAAPIATQFFAYDAFWVGRESLVADLSKPEQDGFQQPFVHQLSSFA